MGSRPTEVGHGLLRQFVNRAHRKLTVGERDARCRAEAEVRPDHLVAESKQRGLVGDRGLPGAHVVEDGLIEARTAAPYLVGDVHGMALAHEVLVPSHAAVRRGLPRLAGQGCAIDHDHRDVPGPVLRHHEAHVHLVHTDVAGRTEAAHLHFCLVGLLAADEEAALGLQHQRRVRRLQRPECLRRRADRRPEDARERRTHERNNRRRYS